jgi:CheY-like chemotaxis protein
VTLEALLSLEKDRRAEQRGGAAAPQPRTYGILVVVDEAGVRGVLSAVLRQRGFVVWLAADGIEALEQYGRNRDAIDMVLMDVRMPGPDGPQTLGALRQLDPQVRCCFMSGELGHYTAQGLRDLGAVRVFTKPFRLPEVAQELWEMAHGLTIRAS